MGERAESDQRRNYSKMIDEREDEPGGKQKAETGLKRKSGMTGQEGRTQPERELTSKQVTCGV